MAPAAHLVVAHQAGQDGQAGRVGRGPAVGPQGVGREVEDGARAGLPAVARLVGVVHLVEQLVVGVEHEHVAVAGAVGAALDGRVGRDRVRPGVALVGVVERDRHLGLRAGNDHVRDADRAAVPVGAEVGVETRRRRRCWRCRRPSSGPRDTARCRVPGVVGREERDGDGRRGSVGSRRRRPQPAAEREESAREREGSRRREPAAAWLPNSHRHRHLLLRQSPGAAPRDTSRRWLRRSRPRAASQAGAVAAPLPLLSHARLRRPPLALHVSAAARRRVSTRC